MRDGRLTRTYISIQTRNRYRARHSHGIALIPLGDRGRVRPEFYDAEERVSLIQEDKYLKFDTLKRS